MCTALLPPSRTAADELSEEPRKILSRLQASPYLALRLIHCSCDGRRIILHGRVPSYYLKQLAQAIARDVSSAQRIDNRIEVA